jgi:protein subunit release factor A
VGKPCYSALRFLYVSLFIVCRLYDYERTKQLQARSELRSAAQGTGDRSDKIRTYNFPQVSAIRFVYIKTNSTSSNCRL